MIAFLVRYRRKIFEEFVQQSFAKKSQSPTLKITWAFSFRNIGRLGNLPNVSQLMARSFLQWRDIPSRHVHSPSIRIYWACMRWMKRFPSSSTDDVCLLIIQVHRTERCEEMKTVPEKNFGRDTLGLCWVEALKINYAMLDEVLCTKYSHSS